MDRRLARVIPGTLSVALGIMVIVLPLAPLAMAQPGGSDGAQATGRADVERLVSDVLRQTAAACPLADPGDQAAFERCRNSLYRGSMLGKSLAPVVLWGRPGPPGTRLKETTLTKFAADIFSGLYAPLFMFTGDYELGFDPVERLYRARVPALFRNALDPGQYPYPFWHDARKWSDYEAANSIALWIDPARIRIVAMQFSAQGKADPRLRSVPRTPPAFDGKWMWTDAGGRIQPQPTLFVGLMRPDNPYLGRLDGAYRTLADALRKGTCNDCHMPDNPARMKRLVLMQTPAHAAGEIKRIMRAVRTDRMPLDDTGFEKELDADTKAAILQYGAAFEELIDAAREWEATTR